MNEDLEQIPPFLPVLCRFMSLHFYYIKGEVFRTLEMDHSNAGSGEVRMDEGDRTCWNKNIPMKGIREDVEGINRMV